MFFLSPLSLLSLLLSLSLSLFFSFFPSPSLPVSHSPSLSLSFMNETLRRLTTVSFQLLFHPLQLCLSFHMYPNLPIHKYPSFIFVEQLTYISPFNMPSSICKCDKPLESLSTCPVYFIFSLL